MVNLLARRMTGKGKHDPSSVVSSNGPSMRSRSHAEKTVDGRYRCLECGHLSNTLEAQDAHHFKVHERQPAQTYSNTPL